MPERIYIVLVQANFDRDGAITIMRAFRSWQAALDDAETELRRRRAPKDILETVARKRDEAPREFWVDAGPDPDTCDFLNVVPVTLG